MSKNVISIDGGGTKTLGVLYNKEGQELKRYSAPSSNFAVDPVQAKIVITDVINNLIKDYLVDSIQIGVAGYSMIKNIKALELELSKQFNMQISIHPDAHLGLYSAQSSNLPLVYVVGGTGSIIYTVKDNQVFRFGGNGHLFGDYGSAYSVVMETFLDILSRMDLNKKMSLFDKHILGMINVSDRQSLIGYIYKTKKQDIASLAVEVSKMAHLGQARRILKKEANKIALNIYNAVKKSKIKTQFTLALRGGFIEKGFMVKEDIINLLLKKKLDFVVELDSKEPVYGGYKLSLLLDRRELK